MWLVIQAPNLEKFPAAELIVPGEVDRLEVLQHPGELRYLTSFIEHWDDALFIPGMVQRIP
jgi:hypothetical protein